MSQKKINAMAVKVVQLAKKEKDQKGQAIFTISTENWNKATRLEERKQKTLEGFKEWANIFDTEAEALRQNKEQ